MNSGVLLLNPAPRSTKTPMARADSDCLEGDKQAGNSEKEAKKQL